MKTQNIIFLVLAIAIFLYLVSKLIKRNNRTTSSMTSSGTRTMALGGSFSLAPITPPSPPAPVPVPSPIIPINPVFIQPTYNYTTCDSILDRYTYLKSLPNNSIYNIQNELSQLENQYKSMNCNKIKVPINSTSRINFACKEYGDLGCDEEIGQSLICAYWGRRCARNV